MKFWHPAGLGWFFWNFHKSDVDLEILVFWKKSEIFDFFFCWKIRKKQKIWNFRISPKPCWHWWLILRGREEKSISVHASEWNETDAKMIAVSSVLEHRTIATVSSFISASDCMSCLQCWTYVKNNLDTSKSQWCCVCCYWIHTWSISATFRSKKRNRLLKRRRHG